MSDKARLFRQLIEAEEILIQPGVTTGSLPGWCSRWGSNPPASRVPDCRRPTSAGPMSG
jgi:hypothetical protein